MPDGQVDRYTSSAADAASAATAVRWIIMKQFCRSGDVIVLGCGEMQIMIYCCPAVLRRRRCPEAQAAANPIRPGSGWPL